ncbi:lysM and putative peptidoglycan-binding domain-containing protein 2-like [Ornithodoros turicata]|uniref:lysM and putative peptidoglycan-binding domain-containing protein 2-like n=1 Tax=Ornithodoros turicata TaxID=34597 RepID=UPI00313979D3
MCGVSRANMSASSGNETARLGSYAKKQTKYGSTCNHVLRTGKTIKHLVQPNDTLQGLALRYGVTMEDIKRENKLWTSDSLFLKTWLDIPAVHNFHRSDEDLCVSNGGSADKQPSVHGQSGGARLLPSSEEEDSRQGEESMRDFLCRIDDSIARSKDQIKVLERNIGYPADDLFLNRSRPTANSLHARKSIGSSSMSDLSGDPSLAPHPVVMTQGRKVKSSLQRHEREHEEIFEL